jgi:hypothetical protein
VKRAVVAPCQWRPLEGNQRAIRTDETLTGQEIYNETVSVELEIAIVSGSPVSIEIVAQNKE